MAHYDKHGNPSPRGYKMFEVGDTVYIISKDDAGVDALEEPGYGQNMECSRYLYGPYAHVIKITQHGDLVLDGRVGENPEGGRYKWNPKWVSLIRRAKEQKHGTL